MVSPEFAVWEAIHLTATCDSPFRLTPIAQWECGLTVYHKSQINYFLEGYAMRHYNYWSGYASSLVLVWKNAINIKEGGKWPSELVNEYTWFMLGWADHGPVHWYGKL